MEPKKNPGKKAGTNMEKECGMISISYFQVM